LEKAKGRKEKENVLKYLKKDINNIYTEQKYTPRSNYEDNLLNPFEEAKEIYDLYDDKIINYVAGILDPEFNYNTGVMVKQPSLLNVPSVSIPIKTLTTLPTQGFSSVCIAWNPSLFCTSQTLQNIKIGYNIINDEKVPVYANRICSVLYSTGTLSAGLLEKPSSSWDAPVFGVPDNLPEVGVAKARLVSAKIKISFRGPILNQGGTVMACATYLGTPGVIAATTDTNEIWRNKPEMVGEEARNQATWRDMFAPVQGQMYNPDDLSPFEEKIISNGIWAKNVNITKDANGISAVFIPSDPMDEIFYKTGTYYGEDVNQESLLSLKDKGTTLLYSDKGAKLCYLFNVQGIPPELNPITIETYTNWEVIPTALAASTLRNTQQTNLTNKESVQVKELLNEYFNVSNGIHTVSNNYVGGFIDNIWNVAKSLAKKAYEKLTN
jgi:hypothetical protein